MDITKLKLNKFNNIITVNFPEYIETGYREFTDNTEVIIYFIENICDIAKFVKFCSESNLPENNRTVMVFRKGNKTDVNRDTIITPFKAGNYPDFKFRAPMLCSLSDKLSAFVMSFEKKQS